MKRLFSIILLLTFVGLSGTAYTDDTAAVSTQDLMPESFHPRVEQAIMFALNRFHYKDIILDDSLSAQMFDQYIERLDYNKSYFLKSDINQFGGECN